MLQTGKLWTEARLEGRLPVPGSFPAELDLGFLSFLVTFITGLWQGFSPQQRSSGKIDDTAEKWATIAAPAAERTFFSRCSRVDVKGCASSCLHTLELKLHALILLLDRCCVNERLAVVSKVQVQSEVGRLDFIFWMLQPCCEVSLSRPAKGFPLITKKGPYLSCRRWTQVPWEWSL